MARRSIKQLNDGDGLDDIYLVSEKQFRSNKNGNHYLQLEIRDRSGAVSARLWNATEHQFRSFDEGDFLRIRGKAQLFQGSIQVIFTAFEKVNSSQVNLADFLPQTEQDISRLFDRLRQFVRKVSNPHLKGLVECFLMDETFVQGFCKAPAGIRNHHAYLGGLLEHVVNMLDAADRLLPLYPEVQRDLVTLGIFLHDIGKVRELSFERVFGYSDEGQLLGHLSIGVEMLSAVIAKVPDLTGEPFPTELALRLKHIILSHHGTYEFGSPRLPMTPEAIFVHYLDNLDAKVHSFVRDIRDDKNETSAWTPYNASIDRRLFKGTREGADPVSD